MISRILYWIIKFTSAGCSRCCSSTYCGLPQVSAVITLQVIGNFTILLSIAFYIFLVSKNLNSVFYNFNIYNPLLMCLLVSIKLNMDSSVIRSLQHGLQVHVEGLYTGLSQAGCQGPVAGHHDHWAWWSDQLNMIRQDELSFNYGHFSKRHLITVGQMGFHKNLVLTVFIQSTKYVEHYGRTCIEESDNVLHLVCIWFLHEDDGRVSNKRNVSLQFLACPSLRGLHWSGGFLPRAC